MKQTPLLSVKEVSYRYDLRSEPFALSNVSLEVKQGEWLAILGDNGSGKSTLAKLMVGLVEPESGSIQLNEQTIDQQNKSLLHKRVGIVFQNPDNQFIGTTVQDDVAFGLENLNMSYDKMEKRVFEALKQVDMYHLREKDPSQLSGGQKQRVAIAGALALKPDLVIFDEAFIMLDPKGRRELLAHLKSIQDETQIAIISITHDPNEAILADQLLVLDEGKVVSQGDVWSVFSENKHLHPPFAEQFRRELKQKGIAVPDVYMSNDELVAWLCK